MCKGHQCSCNLDHSLTIDGLYASDVIVMQSEVGGVASVVRSHQRAGKLGMPQTQGVANLMSSYNSQVGA